MHVIFLEGKCSTVRMRMRSACVVLAWSMVMIIVVPAGLARPARPVPASTRTAASSTSQVLVTSMLSAGPAAAGAFSPGPGVRYAVREGDTLSGIAARFAVPGGWPALYAANRAVIGADPDVLRPGITVVLPGVQVPARYTVAAGDTLSGIAARFAVPGGWPALYAANRPVIGPDPDVIHPGTVLVISRPAPSPPAVPVPAPPKPAPLPPTPAPSAAAPGGHHQPPPTPAPAPARANTGMPHWLTTVLLAAGLIIGLAFLAEPLLLVRRRHAAQEAQAARDAE